VLDWKVWENLKGAIVKQDGDTEYSTAASEADLVPASEELALHPATDIYSVIVSQMLPSSHGIEHGPQQGEVTLAKRTEGPGPLHTGTWDRLSFRRPEDKQKGYVLPLHPDADDGSRLNWARRHEQPSTGTRSAHKRGDTDSPYFDGPYDQGAAGASSAGVLNRVSRGSSKGFHKLRSSVQPETQIPTRSTSTASPPVVNISPEKVAGDTSNLSKLSKETAYTEPVHRAKTGYSKDAPSESDDAQGEPELPPYSKEPGPDM
jgi:hypothetical protein